MAAAAVESAVSSSLDDEGYLVLSLERKSVQPYRSQDEYLYAMREDLAEWFNTLYTGLDVDADNFFSRLETGVVLCQHANTVQGYIRNSRNTGSPSSRSSSDGASGSHNGGLNGVVKALTSSSSSGGPSLSRSSSFDSESDLSAVVFRRSAKPGSFQSRDNVSNFLAWCRAPPVSIPDTLLFETEDLVSRKNERNVVLCVLEVARRGAKYGMPAPTLVQLEAEIDREIAAEARDQATPLPPQPPAPAPVKKRTVDMMSLDEMVRMILARCTCPDQFPMVRVSEGKYKFGEADTLIFVRILRNHVMVRIGGGWDTLDNYLDRHDPCRCAARKGQKGHGSAFIPRAGRRMSAPDGPTTHAGRQSVETPASTAPTMEHKRAYGQKSSGYGQTTTMPATTTVHAAPTKMSTPRPAGRGLPVPVSRGRAPSPTPGRSRRDSTSSLNERDLATVQRLTGSKRPGDRQRTPEVTSPEEVRGRSRSRTRDTSSAKRSHSLGGSDVNKRTVTRTKTSPLAMDAGDQRDTLMVARDASGRLRLRTDEDEAPSRQMPPTRVPLTPDKLLHSAPKLRSQISADDASLRPAPGDTPAPSKANAPVKATLRHSRTLDLPGADEAVCEGLLGGMRRRSVSSFSLNCDYDDYPDAPPEDEDLNAHMERLFEEYKRVEQSGHSAVHHDDERTKSKTAGTGGGEERGRSGRPGGGQRGRSRSATRATTNTKPATKRPQSPAPRIKNTPIVHKRPQSPAPKTDTTSIVHKRPQSPVPKTDTTPTVHKRPQSPAPKTDTTPTVHKRPQSPSPKTDTTPIVHKRPQSPAPKTDTTPTVHKRPQSPAPHRTPISTRPTTRPATTKKTAPATQKPDVQTEKVKKAQPVRRTGLSTVQATGNVSRASPPAARSASVGRMPLKLKPHVADDVTTSLRRRDSEESLDKAPSTDGRKSRARVSRQTKPAARGTPVSKDAGLVRKTSNDVTPVKKPVRKSPSTTSVTIKRDDTTDSLNNACPASPTTSDLYNYNTPDVIVINGDDCPPAHRPDVTSSRARPRRDGAHHSRTRIPAPLFMGGGRRASTGGAMPYNSNLKRFDSGVDIANLSPSETSYQGDDEPRWPQHRALLADELDLENDTDYY